MPFSTNSSISRRLLQEVSCSNDPCPGMMTRNPSTCACECADIEECPGNQIWNEPLCQCGCSTTPTCIAPLSFNPIQCGCECPKERMCPSGHHLDVALCDCVVEAASICPSDPCPGGVQYRNPQNECQCECGEVDSECPGNQMLNVLCQCQCEKTPICTGPRQQFNSISCQCECVPCADGHTLDESTCDCLKEDNSLLLPPQFHTSPTQQSEQNLCTNEVTTCPGNLEWNQESCSCQCGADRFVECPGNQELNVLCQCSCPSTPVCRAPKKFDGSLCQCTCSNEQICMESATWDSETCQCIETMDKTQDELYFAAAIPSKSPSFQIEGTLNANHVPDQLYFAAAIPSKSPSFQMELIEGTLNANPVIIPEGQCLTVGQMGCGTANPCCNADELGILCIASSVSNTQSKQSTDGGSCCIGYNHMGCTTDSDCCFENSYCEYPPGQCRRKVMQLSGRYDPTESNANYAITQSANQETSMQSLEGNGKQSQTESSMLSSGIKIFAVILSIFVVSNVICCVRAERSWTKEQAKKKRFTVGANGVNQFRAGGGVSIIGMEEDRDHVIHLKKGEFDDTDSD